MMGTMIRATGKIYQQKAFCTMTYIREFEWTKFGFSAPTVLQKLRTFLQSSYSLHPIKAVDQVANQILFAQRELSVSMMKQDKEWQ